MQRHVRTLIVALLAIAGPALTAGPTEARIHANLETPDGFASQVSNIQGWAYTTNEGAELIQPFQVFLDGLPAMEVPCCSDRADVREHHPEAPEATGFSGVINWAREALGSDGEVELLILIEDTSGDFLQIVRTIDVYALSSFPFNASVAAFEADGVLRDELDLPEATTSQCRLENVPGDDAPVAEIACTNLVATSGDGSEIEVCDGEVRFVWDKGAQGFRQSTSCEPLPRWTDNGDGTATDNWTGLVWELKTGVEGVGQDCPVTGGPDSCSDPHDVNNRYSWSPTFPFLPIGSAFTRFLYHLNLGRKADDDTYGCFAGYCDWRIPTIEELRSLALPCGGLTCGTIPGPTASARHWSSTSYAQTAGAWDVDFVFGSEDPSDKRFHDAVRAVRGVAKKQTGEGIRFDGRPDPVELVER